jgi:hypothetical protein
VVVVLLAVVVALVVAKVRSTRRGAPGDDREEPPYRE